jgi:hypothetical protein
MGVLVKNKHLNLYKKYTEQLISDLGKTISIFSSSNKKTCNNCVYDKVHKCSSGSYNGTGPKPFTGMVCPVCNGKGIMSNNSSKNITAICRWVKYSSSDDMNKKEKYGIEEERVLMVKTKVIFYEEMKNAEYFIYDSERYRLKNIIKRGMKSDVVCVAYLEKENV